MNLILNSVCVLALVMQAVPWREPDCDARVEIRAVGDFYHRDVCQAMAIIDFQRLLGPKQILTAGEPVLVDSEGHRVAVDLAEGRSVPRESGNPVLRLRWSCETMSRFEDRVWHLYFRTAASGQPGVWRRLEKTFGGERRGVIYATSFEQPEPGRAGQPLGLSPAGRDGAGESTDRSWTQGVAHSGGRSLKIARTVTGTPAANSNRPHWRTWPPPAIEIHPGEIYRLSGWLKCARIKDNGGATVSLIFLDGENRRLAEPRSRFESSRQEHDWLPLAVSATAPPDARRVEISFSLHGEGEVYLDDVELSVVAGSRIPDPAVEVGPVERRPGS